MTHLFTQKHTGLITKLIRKIRETMLAIGKEIKKKKKCIKQNIYKVQMGRFVELTQEKIFEYLIR